MHTCVCEYVCERVKLRVGVAGSGCGSGTRGVTDEYSWYDKDKAARV